MKISELISKLEQQGNFKDDPSVKVRFEMANGTEVDIDAIITAPNNGGVLIVANHNCPTPKAAEPVDRYYWNGKLLADMSRDEIEAALLLMLVQRPLMNISVAAPVEKTAPAKAETKV